MVNAVSNSVASNQNLSVQQADKEFANTLQQTEEKAKKNGAAVSNGSASGVNGGQPAVNGSAASGGIVSNTVQAGQTVADPLSQINRLNSDGDQVVMTMTAEGKLQLPVPIGEVPVGLGGKAQYGFGITVKQVGDTPQPGTNGQQPQYEVTFDKNLLAGGMIEPPVPGIDPAAELNVRTSGSVTMRFDSKEDAARAVATLQRLAASETVRDAGNAISPVGGGALSNPFSNPVTNQGSGLPTPGNLLADQIKPSAQDMTFLRDHVVSYTSRLGLQERGKVAVKFANLGIEPRLDANQWISRTVELPQNGQPGRLTYTLSGDLQLSTKEKLTLGQQQFDQLEIGYVPQNIVDHGQVRGEVSISWELPAGTATSNGAASSSGGGNNGNGSASSIPELSGLGEPDRISARLQLDYQTQGLTDLSRTDIQRLSINVTTENPGQHAGQVVNSLLHGDLQGAFGGMGDDFTVTAQADTIRRDGIHQQHEIGVEVADVAEAKVSLEANIGLDDVTGRRTRTFTGTDIANRLGGTPPAQEPQPTGDAPSQTPAKPDQVVVVPHEGLNVRETPEAAGDKISAFQSGTFLQPTGQQATDAQGNQWIEVTGLDANDKHVQGWVSAQYVQTHAAGAMDDTGRINPDLDKQGYSTHTVVPGDTIWDVAKREGVDFQEMVALNSDHLIDPNLIFPGDTLYIPGTGHPVAPEPTEPQPTQPQPNPSTPSGDQPSGSQPSGGQPSSGQPSGGQPSGGQPSGGQPSGGQPSGGQPSGGQPSGADNTPTVNPPVNGTGRPDLNQVLHDYQMPNDPGGMIDWKPGAPLGWFTGSVNVTATEGKMLDGLSVFELKDFSDIKDKAENTANAYYPSPQDKRGNFGSTADFVMWFHNDGHNDAFRHSYWNALMTKRYGADFTENFTNAHEGAPGNPADREAMDLYNNAVGRRIATENPNASDEQLAQLVQQAIQRGEMIVIDRNGNLAWSDGVSYGEHGIANDGVAPGVMPRPDANARTAS